MVIVRGDDEEMREKPKGDAEDVEERYTAGGVLDRLPSRSSWI